MRIINHNLYEFAYSRSKAGSLLNILSYQISLHFIKIKFVQTLNKNHWKKELWSWVDRCRLKLKINNRTPDKDFYFENLFSTPLYDKNIDTVRNRIFEVGDEENCVIDASPEDVLDFLEDVFDRLSETLAKDGLKSKADFYKWVDENT